MSNKTLTLRANGIPQIHSKYGVGFDSIFDELFKLENRQTENYPPYNIIQHNDDEYVVSLAVAGFGLNDLKVTKEKNYLIVEGTNPQTDSEYYYLHKGIGMRNFRREFKLADHVDIVAATLELGILSIQLKREIPEQEKPKVIAINYNK